VSSFIALVNGLGVNYLSSHLVSNVFLLLAMIFLPFSHPPTDRLEERDTTWFVRHRLQCMCTFFSILIGTNTASPATIFTEYPMTIHPITVICMKFLYIPAFISRQLSHSLIRIQSFTSQSFMSPRCLVGQGPMMFQRSAVLYFLSFLCTHSTML